MKLLKLRHGADQCLSPTLAIRRRSAAHALTQIQPASTGGSTLQAHTGVTSQPQTHADGRTGTPPSPWRSPFEVANLLRSARSGDTDDAEALIEDAGRIQVP